MSAMFLTRRLAMWQHLESEQLPKEGLRYWFQNDKVPATPTPARPAAFLRSTVPAFQLRRDALDEHLLATAVAEGAELLRPARVRTSSIGDFDHRVTIEARVKVRTARPRRSPAAGSSTPPAARLFLGRRLSLIERNERASHRRDLVPLEERPPHRRLRRPRPALALARQRQLPPPGHEPLHRLRLLDLGHPARQRRDQHRRGLRQAPRRPAPRQGLARRLHRLPAEDPVAAELLDGARSGSRICGPSRTSPTPRSSTWANGWALLGDAAAFLDPYYSPGLDHASFTAEATVEIIKAQTSGEDVAARIAEHNETFLRSYWRFFGAIYKDKYYYMGEPDLLSAAFLIDTAQYYIFVVIPAYRLHGQVPLDAGARSEAGVPQLPPDADLQPPLQSDRPGPPGRRGRRGCATTAAASRRYFNLGLAPFRMVGRGLRIWARAESDFLRLSPEAAVREPDAGPGSDDAGSRRQIRPSGHPLLNATAGGGPPGVFVSFLRRSIGSDRSPRGAPVYPRGDVDARSAPHAPRGGPCWDRSARRLPSRSALRPVLRPQQGPVGGVRLAGPQDRTFRHLLLPRGGNGRPRRRSHGRALVRQALLGLRARLLRAQVDRPLCRPERLPADHGDPRPDRRGHGRRDRGAAHPRRPPA